MKIVHVHNEIENKGGAEVYLQQLQTLMPLYGLETYWIGIKHTENGWKWCVNNGSWTQCGKPELIRQITSWLNEQQADLICIHNLFDNQLVNALIAQLPTIKFSHSPVIVCPGKDKFWRASNMGCTRPFGLHCFYHAYTEGCTNRHPKRLLSDFSFVREEIFRAKHKYHRVVVMSNYSADRLLECGIPSEKVVINPYFTTMSSSGAKVTTAKAHLLFTGRLVEGKGVLNMIRAVTPILHANQNVVLDIVGDGPLMDDAKRLVESNRIQNAVNFHGWQPRESIEHFLHRCRLLIFPSTYPESFGIAGIEALMAGKPVVAFDVGGVSTWLVNEINGFLIPAVDEIEMGEKIQRLLADKELYERMSLAAAHMAKELFVPERHMRVLKSVFSSACQLDFAKEIQ